MQAHQPISAKAFDPNFIVDEMSIASGFDCFLRKRPPSDVRLEGGHTEHLLMCTRGLPIQDQPSYSVLTTEDGVYKWHSCSNWHITFIPAGYPLHWVWSYMSESINLSIHPDMLDTMLEHMSGSANMSNVIRPMFRVADHDLSHCMHRLHTEISDPKAQRLAIESLLGEIGLNLTGLFGNGLELKEHSAGVDLITLHCSELIHDRLDENLSLAELARESGLSPFHFLRRFKEATGFPPHEYQLRLRIKKARELLLSDPKLSVAQIGFELGFADESHFRRHFKRIVGFTPSQFRRNHYLQ